MAEIEENEVVNTSIAQMAARGGVSTSAFYGRLWATMTLEGKIEDAGVWKDEIAERIKRDQLLLASLLTGRAAMVLELNKSKEAAS